MLTTQECILTCLLNCGTADLSMLDDINYDLDDILEELMENGCLSLNNLFESVFRKGISELTDVVESNKEEIKTDLEHLLSVVPSSDDLCDDIQRFEDELSDDDYNLLESYGGFEWREDIQECLDELENLDPENDIDYFCNCQDTSIRFADHEETYRRLFENEIEEIEHCMGFEFY